MPFCDLIGFQALYSVVFALHFHPLRLQIVCAKKRLFSNGNASAPEVSGTLVQFLSSQSGWTIQTEHHEIIHLTKENAR